jgi:multiple sugar transport system permease protein
MRMTRRTIWENLTSYGFILPFLVIFIIFLGYPVFYSLYLSFHKVTSLFDVFGGMKYVGLQNFMKLAQDREFWWALLVTGYYAGLSMPSGIGLSLILAVLLNRAFKLRSLFRSAFFMPFVLDVFVVGIVWTFLYASPYGIIVKIANFLGIHYFDKTGFLSHPYFAMPAVVLAMVLKNAGFGMILYLAALQNIPRSIYEAADIDGAGAWRKLVHVTVPLLKPVTLFLVIIGVINVLSAFAEFYAMTDGGPSVNVWGRALGATKVSGVLLFRHFESLRLGYAASISWILLVITLAISLFSVKVIRYDET